MRDWEKYAHVLDLHLNAGWSHKQIARAMGISHQRVGQMLILAKEQLAFRVFKGVRRPVYSRLRGEWWA